MDYLEKLGLGTVYWSQEKGVHLLWLLPSHRELGPCSSALHRAVSLAVAWEARSYHLGHRGLVKFRNWRKS